MNKDLTEFKDFDLQKKPEVESYTFKGKDFQLWFNITFTEGRIYLSGDAGDNTFIVGGNNEYLKNWLFNLDWETELLDWSPMQKMQYKQLIFAGNWFHIHNNTNSHLI